MMEPDGANVPNSQDSEADDDERRIIVRKTIIREGIGWRTPRSMSANKTHIMVQGKFGVMLKSVCWIMHNTVHTITLATKGLTDTESTIVADLTDTHCVPFVLSSIILGMKENERISASIEYHSPKVAWPDNHDESVLSNECERMNDWIDHELGEFRVMKDEELWSVGWDAMKRCQSGQCRIYDGKDSRICMSAQELLVRDDEAKVPSIPLLQLNFEFHMETWTTYQRFFIEGNEEGDGRNGHRDDSGYWVDKIMTPQDCALDGSGQRACGFARVVVHWRSSFIFKIPDNSKRQRQCITHIDCDSEQADVLGEGESSWRVDENECIDAVDEVLKTMAIGDSCTLRIPISALIDDNSSNRLGIPSATRVLELAKPKFHQNRKTRLKAASIFIRLLDITDHPEKAQNAPLDEEDIIMAEKLKLSGNKWVAKGLWNRALCRYEQGYAIVQYFNEHVFEMKEIHLIAARRLKLSLLLNAALVSLKLEKYGNVLHQCDEALEIDQRCQKALFRRGKAFAQLGRLIEAERDFNAVLEIDDSNTDARKALRGLHLSFKAEEKTEKVLMQRMLEGISPGTDAEATSSSDDVEEDTYDEEDWTDSENNSNDDDEWSSSGE